MNILTKMDLRKFDRHKQTYQHNISPCCPAAEKVSLPSQFWEKETLWDLLLADSYHVTLPLAYHWSRVIMWPGKEAAAEWKKNTLSPAGWSKVNVRKNDTELENMPIISIGPWSWARIPREWLLQPT